MNVPRVCVTCRLESEEQYAAKPTQVNLKQIFDKYTATLDTAFEERLSCPKPHHDMCKLDESDDLYRRIEGVLNRYPSRVSAPNSLRMRQISNEWPQL